MPRHPLHHAFALLVCFAVAGCVGGSPGDAPSASDPADVVAAVRFPDDYQRIDGATGCVDEDPCWRVDALPAEVQDTIVAALELAGARDVTFVCIDERTSDGQPAACAAEGTAGGVPVSITVARDFDYDSGVALDVEPGADLPVEAFVSTSSVIVSEGPAL